MKRTILAACAVLMVVATGAAHAQYPNKPIRLIVPFAPGGSSDIVSRSFAGEMTRIFGQSVVVEGAFDEHAERVCRFHQARSAALE